jgi:hypothetical protein
MPIGFWGKWLLANEATTFGYLGKTENYFLW